MLGAASGFIHTEIMPVNRTNFESLDKARLENYLQDILNDPEVPTSREEWIERLKALGFMTEGVTEEAVCTIAGIALFGIRPRQILRQSGIRLVFFDSEDKQYQARLDKILEAPMVGRFKVGEGGKSLIDPGLIEKTLEQMEPFISREPNKIDENFRRPRQWLYPIEAIRELMINSLVHRDWSRFVDVEITGYNNRLEIISPGSLPNSMTIEKMLAGQRSARNNLIVEVMRDYGYVDARGMGIRTKVLPALKESGNDQKFSATDDFVQFSLFLKGQRSTEDAPLNRQKVQISDLKGHESAANAPIYAPLTVFQMHLLKLMREHPDISYDQMADSTKKDRSTVMRNISKLKEAGLVKRIGSKKTGHWEVIEP